MSVGGDGTTLLTALALQKSKVPFGIIPMGSANGMARELNVPTDPMHALNDLLLSQIIVAA
jgi:diacylglycerol kinase (ATP)